MRQSNVLVAEFVGIGNNSGMTNTVMIVECDRNTVIIVKQCMTNTVLIAEYERNTVIIAKQNMTNTVKIAEYVKSTVIHVIAEYDRNIAMIC